LEEAQLLQAGLEVVELQVGLPLLVQQAELPQVGLQEAAHAFAATHLEACVPPPMRWRLQRELHSEVGNTS